MTKTNVKRLIFVIFFLLIIIILFAVCRTQWQKVKEESAVVTENTEKNDYSATEQIEAARQKLKDDPQKPAVITDVNTVEKKVAICFEGIADKLVLEQILDYLKAHDMTATFFIPAVEVSEDANTAQRIRNAGHDMESYTLYGINHMEKMEQDELIQDFCRAQAVYEALLGESPSLLKCNATDYTDEVMEAADASGYTSIVYPTHYLNYASLSSEEMAKDYIASAGKGSIIAIKLNGYLDEIEFIKGTTDAKPANDKQPGLTLQEPEEELTETERLLQVVDWLLTALDEANYTTVLAKDLPGMDMGDLTLKYAGQEKRYEEEMAEAITAVPTTERATAFTFRGLGNETELNNILYALQEIDAHATFFVTGQELDQYPEQIQRIIAAGHEIGNGGYLGKSIQELTFAEVCEDIYKNDLLLTEIGVKTDLYMPPYGVVTQEVQMASAAMGKQLIIYTSSPARTEYAEEGYTGIEAVKKYYSKSGTVMHKGDITYFNMNVYEDTDSVADLVKAVYQIRILPTQYGTKADNMLRICTVSELLDNT